MNLSATRPLPLASIYDKVQGDWSEVSEVFLASILRQVRLDARLGEILVAQLSQHFEKLNPWQLNGLILTKADPQVLAILCSFVELKLKAEPLRLASFRIWKKAAELNIPKAAPQNFFVLGGYPRPEKLRNEFLRSNQIFEEWGFHSDQILLAKSTGKTTLVSKEKRLEILNHLMQSNENLSVRQYLEALGGLLHIRTAERDLNTHPELKKKGFTRNRLYVRRDQNLVPRHAPDHDNALGARNRKKS